MPHEYEVVVKDVITKMQRAFYIEADSFADAAEKAEKYLEKGEFILTIE